MSSLWKYKVIALPIQVLTVMTIFMLNCTFCYQYVFIWQKATNCLQVWHILMFHNFFFFFFFFFKALVSTSYWGHMSDVQGRWVITLSRQSGWKALFENTAHLFIQPQWMNSLCTTLGLRLIQNHHEPFSLQLREDISGLQTSEVNLTHDRTWS